MALYNLLSKETGPRVVPSPQLRNRTKDILKQSIKNVPEIPKSKVGPVIGALKYEKPTDVITGRFGAEGTPKFSTRTSKEDISQITSPGLKGFQAGVLERLPGTKKDKEFLKSEVEKSPELFKMETSTQKAPEYLEPLKEQGRLSSIITTGKAGQTAAEVGKQVLSYGIANKIVAGSKAGKAAEQLAKTMTPGQRVRSTILMDQIVDNVAQAPGDIIKAIEENETMGESAKRIALRNVADLAINSVMAGGGEYLRKLKGQENLIDDLLSRYPKQMREVVDKNPNIAKELGLGETTAKEYSKELDKIAKEVQIEESLKKYDKTPEQVENDFKEWRKQTFGGAHGKVTSEEENILKNWYKEETGIDYDKAIQEAKESIGEKIYSKPKKLTEILSEQKQPRNLSKIIDDDDVPFFMGQQTFKETQVPAEKVVEQSRPFEVDDLIMTELKERPKPDKLEKAERFYQETFSTKAPFEFAAETTGKEELAARAGNLNRVTGVVDHNIAKAQVDLEGKEIGKSIQDIFKDAPQEKKKDLYKFIYSMHNIDRAKYGKSMFGEELDEMASKRLAQELKNKNPEFAKIQEEVVKYYNNLLKDYGVESGLVSKQTADMLTDKYKNYVSGMTVKEAQELVGKTNSPVIAKIIKEAKGNNNQIIPLEQQMALMTDKMARNAHKNKLMLTLDDAYAENPQALSRWVKGVSEVPGETIEDIASIGKGFESEIVKQGDNYLINFYKEGQPKQMVVNKTMYNAIKNLESDALDKGLNTIRKYATNPFKSLITTYNPLFAVRNIMRDVPTALIYSNDPIKMVKNVPRAIEQMLKNGEQWKQYQAIGGTRSGLFNYDKGTVIEFAGPKTRKQKITKAIKTGKEKIEAFNNFTETLPRFSEYLASIEKGESQAIALMRAAEVTTDFSRFGKQTKRADAVVPYLNASMQGIDKFARQMRKKPIETMAKGGVVVSVPALILDQVNKNNEAYNEMHARERNQYYHIPKPDGKFYRIPRSREVGVLFGTLFEWMARASRGQEVTPEEIWSTTKENFSPVNGFEQNIGTPANNFWKIVTGKDPDAKNFFGAKIVPNRLQKYSPSKQYDENTTILAKNMGEFLDVSPKAIDYLMDAYTGVIGDVAMPYMKDAKVNWKAPMERAFIADPVYKSDAANKLFDHVDKIKKEAQDYNKKLELPPKLKTPFETESSKLNKEIKVITDLQKQQRNQQIAGKFEEARKTRMKINEASKKALERSTDMEELIKRAKALEKKWRESK